MKRRKIFLGIAFGTSVRDVLRNDTFKILKAQKDLDIIIFTQDIISENMLELKGENVFFEKLHSYQPSFIERVFLNFHKAVLREKCRTIDLGNTAGDTKVLDKFTPLAQFLKKILGYSNVNSLIKKLYFHFTYPKLYKSAFEKYKPDLVVVTRVLNYSIDYALMRRAIAQKVPVISLVSSWDNFTSKGFFPFSLKSLVVWNEVMKKEAIDLFDFPQERIFVSGIPRYDLFFREGDFCSKSAFFKKFGLDPHKKLILYGTGSATTGQTLMDIYSPEPEITKYISDEIESSKFSVPVQLMIRLHPQANLEQYKDLLNKKNTVIHIPGKKTAFHDRLFSKNDDIELGESMMYADVVVNLASTITLDAAVFDTPIVCINFDFRGERPFNMSIKRFYQFDHYAKLKTTGGFDLSESKEQLIKHIDNALINPAHLRENRRRIVEQQCVYTDGKSGERIAHHILKSLEEIN